MDQQLAALGAQQQRLAVERAALLEQLRAGRTGLVQPEQQGAPWSRATWHGAPSPGGTPAPAPWPTPAPRPRPETAPRSVQNVLLILGALLLALAGVVFTAVTYRHLGVVGRALVLLALTTAAGWAPVPLRRRGLTASSEALGAVALVLALLDVVALRKAGVGEEVDGRSYYAVGLGLLAALAAGYATAVPLQVVRVGSAVLAQLPVPLVLARVEPSLPVAATVLALQGLADLAVAAPWSPLPRVSRWTAGLSTVPLCAVSLAMSAQAVDDGHHGAGAGLVAVAAVFVLAWALAAAPLQVVAVTPVVPLLGAAALASVRYRLTDDQLPLVLVAVALLALPVSSWVPPIRRVGPVVSALALSAITLVVEAEAVLEAVFGPFAWLGDPWTRTAAAARDALGPDLVWDGTVVTLVVLAGAAVAVVVGGLQVEQLRIAVPAAGVLVVLAAVTLPLGLATSYRDALLLLLLVALALGLAAALLLERSRVVGVALAASAATTGVLDAVWSTADKDSTLTVLPLVALLAAGLAYLLPGALTGLTLLLGGAEVAAYGAARDLSVDQVGALLVLASAVAVAVSFLLPGLHRLGAELAAAVLGLVAIGLSGPDPGWLSWVLVGEGLLALAVSVRRDRRPVGVLGGALLVASSWVRLVDADVVSPEPYVAPLAALALVLGHLRRRVHEGLGSIAAYGGGLGLALVPSLLRSFVDETPTRGLALLAVCVGVVLVGARARLRAPLLVGGGVLVVEALNLLGPYAAALPRWLLLAVLGLLLVVLGATYEQRLRDLQNVRERFLRLG